MKKISLLFSLFLVIGVLTTQQSYAQVPDGQVYANETTANLYLNNITFPPVPDPDFGIEASNYNYVETSPGNYTVNSTFYLTPGNPYIPEKGTRKITLFGVLSFIPFVTSIAEAKINKHGKCHVVFHVNGSGN